MISTDAIPDPSLVAAAGERALLPIARGIGAIGELLWRSAHSGETLSSDGQSAIGMLLEHLAEYAEVVGFIRDEAADAAHDRELETVAREVSRIPPRGEGART